MEHPAGESKDGPLNLAFDRRRETFDVWPLPRTLISYLTSNFTSIRHDGQGEFSFDFGVDITLVYRDRSRTNDQL